MLSSLKIENIAVIEHAEILFDNGLNILTGETGAGKSIIIDSINTILGERTSKELIRSGADKGRVTAFFENVSYEVNNKLYENDIDIEEDGSLLITRTISSDGRSICKINGCTVTATILRNIGRDLVTICGQHDSQHLLSKESHLRYIDVMADSEELLNNYLECYEKIRAVAKKLKKLKASNDDKEKRLDFLSYQINELSCANITVGEREKLKNEKRKILAREKITNALRKSNLILNGDDGMPGLCNAIYELSECFDELRSYDEIFEGLYSSAENIRHIVNDFSSEVSSFDADFSGEQSDINAIEERLDILYRLSSKYGESEEEMLSLLQNLKEEYESIITSDELISELDNELDELSEELFKRGCCLSDLRKLTALEFEKKVKYELQFLDMPDAEFTVDFKEATATKTGMDEVEFLFSANKGQSPKSLSKIASGGELSRVMLALRCVLSDNDSLDTMIFDEIDTGVSGRAAQKIAYKMRETARNKQVLCVTHLAQIACFAHNHLLVEKQTSENNTFTAVRTLENEDRVREIARIIGGDIITQTTLESAKELISFAQNS